MTNEELVLNIQSGDVDRKEGLSQLYLKNIGMIHKLVKPFKTEMVEYDDLLQEGFIGMMTAVDKFDASKGTMFITYAGYYIQQTVRRYIRNSDVINLSYWLHELDYKYKHFTTEYVNEHGKEPDDETICEELKISELQLSRYRKAIATTTIISLDSTLQSTDSESMKVSETIPDPRRFDEELIEDITEKENSRTLWECVDSLPRNEPEIVRKRILNDMNYREIGESLGVTKQRTEQILKKAYKHLQEDERVLMIARTEGLLSGSLAYKGSLKRFRNTDNESVVEKIAVDRVERERRFLEDKKTVDCFVANNVF